jgi:hypothetical protein
LERTRAQARSHPESQLSPLDIVRFQPDCRLPPQSARTQKALLRYPTAMPDGHDRYARRQTPYRRWETSTMQQMSPPTLRAGVAASVGAAQIRGQAASPFRRSAASGAIVSAGASGSPKSSDPRRPKATLDRRRESGGAGKRMELALAAPLPPSPSNQGRALGSVFI